MINLHRLWSCYRKQPYVWLIALSLCASSYLCLSNLDYALLWSDEVNTALIGNNFLNTGTLTAWDGRNFASIHNEANVNSKGEEVYPPLMFLFSTIGISIFGFNEIGARSVHALVGVLALVMFLLLLRQYFPNNTRLLFFIFLFVCLSPQLLLYFRQARYYAFSVFVFITCFYFYEQYWRSGRLLHLTVMTILGLLAFLNHYNNGAASMLAIAAFHVMTRASATTKKQWLLFALAALFITLAGSAYLYQAGTLTAYDQMHLSFSKGRSFTLVDHALKLFTGLKTIIACDWLSWLVCLWFLIQWKSSANTTDQSSTDYFVQARKLILVGILFFVLSVILSPQRVTSDLWYDIRYSVAALPLLLVMKGMLIDWLIPRSRFLAVTTLVTLLFTSAGAYPFNIKNTITGERTLGFHLLSFLKEIHHPYRPDPVEKLASYLRKHAKQDDLVFVKESYQRENLIFYAGDHVLLCCHISTDNQRLADTITNMRSSLFFDPKIIPDWIVIFNPQNNKAWQLIKPKFYRNWTMVHFSILATQTQRPELHWRTFKPYPKATDGGIYLLRRKSQASDTWY